MPADRDAGRLGGAADQEPVAVQRRSSTRCCRSANQKDDHLPHRGVPVPEVRARDDVGALPRAGRASRARKVVDRARRVTGVHRDAGAAVGRSRDRRRRGGSAPIPVRPRHLVDADLAAARGAWTRRSPPEVLAAADDLRYRDFITVALVVPRGVHVPRQLDLHPRPRGEGRPHPELRLVVAVPGEGRPHLPRASSSSCSRATRCGRMPDDDLVEQAQARSSSSSAWSTRRRSRPATSCACPRRIRSTTSATRTTST